MKKQTAVEWLVEKVMVWENDHEKWIEIPTRELEDFLRQAKAMEREQIVDAHGLKYYDLKEEIISGEQYYINTYKGGEQ